MTNEFITNEINTAHAMINEGVYDQAVERLKMLKNRIHDETILTDIKTFEKEHDDTLDLRLKEINGSSNDQLRKQVDAANQIKSYAVSYLKFFSKLTYDHDIF